MYGKEKLILYLITPIRNILLYLLVKKYYLKLYHVCVANNTIMFYSLGIIARSSCPLSSTSNFAYNHYYNLLIINWLKYCSLTKIVTTTRDFERLSMHLHGFSLYLLRLSLLALQLELWILYYLR